MREIGGHLLPTLVNFAEVERSASGTHAVALLTRPDGVKKHIR